MVNVEPITTPAQPLTAADLRTFLRLNDQGEDALLTELLAAAVERFEDDTARPVLVTTYRQYLSRWPLDIALGRGGVSAVGSVKSYAADGTTTADVTFTADLKTAPARVRLGSSPPTVSGAAGVTVSPVGFVEFTAGWANAAAVPKAVLVALKSLAGYWYEHREAFTERSLRPIEQGWNRVVSRYRLGLFGDWGQ